jgi:hypothetical protein
LGFSCIISISYVDLSVLVPALHCFARPLIDDAACNGIPTAYAVRSFSAAFDLDQQSMASRTLA